MTRLGNRRDRHATVGQIYASVSDGRAPPREIDFDEEGVVAVVGQAGTNEVWYAERTAVDDDEMTFRVLLVDPTRSKGVRFSPQTGRHEFGNRLTSCQWFVGDVTVRRLGGRETLGSALATLCEAFRREMRRGVELRGNANGRADLTGAYERAFRR